MAVKKRKKIKDTSLMGRPKSEKPKSIQKRVRITEDDDMKILAKYGSFTKFVQEALKVLPLVALLLLGSCGKEGRNLLPGETIGSGGVNYLTGTLLYSCNGSNCWISGEISGEEILSGDFHFTGDTWYNGEICTISGCEDYRLAPMINLLEKR